MTHKLLASSFDLQEGHERTRASTGCFPQECGLEMTKRGRLLEIAVATFLVAVPLTVWYEAAPVSKNRHQKPDLHLHYKLPHDMNLRADENSNQ
jgi:hypothetical protein